MRCNDDKINGTRNVIRIKNAVKEGGSEEGKTEGGREGGRRAVQREGNPLHREGKTRDCRPHQSSTCHLDSE